MPERVAYHECGHALVTLLLGGQVRQLTIEPADDDRPARDGDAEVLWPAGGGTPRQFAEKAVQVCLAGPVAEMLYTGDPWHPGLVAEWSADWQQAWEAAAPLAPDERQRLAYLEEQSIRLYRLLGRDDLWAALAALADHLSAHETLDAEQIVEIVEPWLP